MLGGTGRLCEALWFAAVGGSVPNASRRGQDPSLRCKGYGVVMARWRAGHARSLRTAANGLWTRGAREGGSPLLFPLTGCRGTKQPLSASGVRGRLAAHNERRQPAKLARSCGCLPRGGKHCSLPGFAPLNRGPTLTTPQCPAPTVLPKSHKFCKKFKNYGAKRRKTP